ncbi:DNA primase [Solirubrobacter soli]|uniref:DNA primase n=1 Tax=Solirubrobacter soli TaxID=363832 RepID=UPI00041DF9AB|nr:DNA primase [Solirubrobacter soli]
MARYTDDSRERVRDAVDFEQLVGARTELKRAGVNRLQGLCPFHEERTPSFGIDPIEKVYHCFGCGAGGDVFRFVMDTEGLTFSEALEVLAERSNVTLEREAEDPQEAERRQRRERLHALLERTAAYYVRVLWESPEAQFARDYLHKRGLNEDALRAYRVGYAPDAYDRVLLGSQKAGYSTSELLAAGLIQPSRGRAGHIDRFRGRVTFPLTDAKGHVLGFGARAMKADQQPKYLNTSDSDLFHKSRVVYGQDMARAAAAKAGRVVIVEGYTDVIALHQAGVPETVAQMGTALTEQQVDAIARLAPKALLCQDPDSAGQASAQRGLEALTALMKSDKWRTRAVDFKIVRLPSKQDPADVVQNAGEDEMRRLLESAMPIERFLVQRALEIDGPSADELLQEAVRIIAPLPAGVLRDELIKFTAQKLGTSDQVVHEVLRGTTPAQPAPAPQWEGGWNDRGRSNGRGGPQGRGRGGPQGRDRFRDRPAQPPEPVDPRAALARRTQSEEAYLAYCIALPEDGEERLAAVDIEDYFSSPTSRKAAEYLRVHLRHPGSNLPSGDEDLARLVAKLTVDANRLEATPAKLELEALQLDLHRLERHIANARLSGTTGVGALAVERQRVLDMIRHRLT